MDSRSSASLSGALIGSNCMRSEESHVQREQSGLARVGAEDVAEAGGDHV